jgi:hypothetical protein
MSLFGLEILVARYRSVNRRSAPTRAFPSTIDVDIGFLRQLQSSYTGSNLLQRIRKYETRFLSPLPKCQFDGLMYRNG